MESKAGKSHDFARNAADFVAEHGAEGAEEAFGSLEAEKRASSILMLADPGRLQSSAARRSAH